MLDPAKRLAGSNWAILLMHGAYLVHLKPVITSGCLCRDAVPHAVLLTYRGKEPHHSE